MYFYVCCRPLQNRKEHSQKRGSLPTKRIKSHLQKTCFQSHMETHKNPVLEDGGKMWRLTSAVKKQMNELRFAGALDILRALWGLDDVTSFFYAVNPTNLSPSRQSIYRSE